MKVFYLSLILIITSFSVFGQRMDPPIQNYTSVEYDGASQNWDVGIDAAGNFYAANNQGLLQYDGQQWELFPLRNGAVIRSVLPHKERVYTGSYKEFGYWKRSRTGEMEYTSLMPLLKDSVGSEEFWGILPFKNSIYFRSFGAIYKYDHEKIEPVLRAGANKMVVYQGKLLLSIGTKGLFFLQEDGSLKPLPNQKLIEGQRILDIEVEGKKFWAGTKDALYRFDGEQLEVFPDKALNEKLAEFEFNHVLKVGDDNLLLATVRNGMLHYNLKTGRTTVYNRENGLQNNTILGMAEKGGKVWLGLDNGIDQINLDSPIRFFTNESGELGAVYDLANHNGQLYAATNTGVYNIDDEGISMLRNSQGHSWNLEVLDQKLFSNHNSGTYIMKNGELVPLEGRTGSFQIQKGASEDKYFIGNYTGISIFDPSEERLINLKGLRFPVRKLIFEDAYTGWVEHANEGVYRLKMSEDFGRAISLKRIGNREDEVGHRSKIFDINGQVAILMNKEWFRYNKFRDTLETFEELKDYKNHELLLQDGNGYWFSNREDNSIKFTDFRNTRVKITFADLDQRLIKGHEALIKVADSTYYITLKDGFAKIDLDEIITYRKKEVLEKPLIKGFLDETKRYALDTPPSVPYEAARRLTILTGLPGSEVADVHYELIGNQNLAGEVEKGRLQFQNLSQGEYKLNLYAISPHGLKSALTTLGFTIEAPWYLSRYMKSFYLLLLLILTWLIYEYNRRKLRKHQVLLEQKLSREHQEHLDQLEKKRLNDEIMMKRKELANTTMMAAKKNEVLMDIQRELNKDREKFSNQYRIKHIMNKINQAIKNKDEWQVFETNFKEVHEDFSKDLLEKYPNLTGKDLKLCSYLKMNLSSKEIAPLMGKSVRGVEVHRYRLRKKLQLDGQENLSSFLLKNF